MNGLLNFENQRDLIDYGQNLPNKSTVKKELSNRLMRFNAIGDKQNQYHQSNLLLNLNKNTVRKNQISDQLQVKCCANHPDRDAQYIVKIDGEVLNYCRKCATHIASQGFDVHKVASTDVNCNKNYRMPNQQGDILLSNISPSRARQSNPRKQEKNQRQKRFQLTNLTKSLKKLRGEYISKSESLTEISETFQIQKQSLTNYYQELISYIQEIRDIHLQAIQESGANTIQVCEIQKGQILQTVGQIDEMIYDIEFNMENILSEVDQQSYNECFEFYRQKEGIFSHRLEQLGSEAQPWPCSKEQQLNAKVESFRAFVNELHLVGEEPQKQNEKRLRNNY